MKLNQSLIVGLLLISVNSTNPSAFKALCAAANVYLTCKPLLEVIEGNQQFLEGKDAKAFQASSIVMPLITLAAARYGFKKLPSVNQAITTHPSLLLPAGYTQYLVASEIPKQVALNSDNKLPNNCDDLKKLRELLKPQASFFEFKSEKGKELTIQFKPQQSIASNRRLAALNSRLQKMNCANNNA